MFPLPVESSRPKVGSGAAGEVLRDERRREIRTWTRDDVKRHLTAEGTLRDLTIFVSIDVLKAETASEVLPSFGAGQRRRVPLIDALYYHKIDGNALLDFTQADLMRVVGIHQLGMAKAVLRVVAALCDPQHIIPDVYFNPVASQLAVTSSNSAPDSVACRYAALDPFSGWEKQMHSATGDHDLRQRSKTKFDLGRLFGRSSNAGSDGRHPTDDFETQHAIAAARDELEIVLRREAQELLASQDAADTENPQGLGETGSNDQKKEPEEHMEDEVEGKGDVKEDEKPIERLQVAAPLENVIRMSSAYSAGILEAERRLTEIRANYRSIVTVVGSQLTIGLVASATSRCWSWDGDTEHAMVEQMIAAVEEGRAARHHQTTTASTRSKITGGSGQQSPQSGQRAAQLRPSSASSRPYNPAAPIKSLVPSSSGGAPLVLTLDTSLTRNDFICLIKFLTDRKEPAEFDQLLAFFSTEYGKDRIENVRRQQAAQTLFRKLDTNSAGFIAAAKVIALVTKYCAENGISTRTPTSSSSSPDLASLTLTGRRKRNSSAGASSSSSRPSSAPMHRRSTDASSPSSPYAVASSSHTSQLSTSLDRPTSASSQRKTAPDGEDVVDEAAFCDFVVEELVDCKSDQFDNVLMHLRVIVEHLVAEERPFRTLTQQEFEDAVAQGTTVANRSLVIVLSSSVDPSVFVQAMFASGQKTLRTAAALHKQVADPSLICAPAIRQAKLLVFCVDGELSMKKALESIQSDGMERGNWIFIDCPENTLDPTPQHVTHKQPMRNAAESSYDIDYFQIALDEAEEDDKQLNASNSSKQQQQQQPRNGMMNIFLRQAARLLLSKSSLSIHRSFRLFVRCPVDKLDDNNVPQIARSISLILPLRAQ